MTNAPNTKPNKPVSKRMEALQEALQRAEKARMEAIEKEKKVKHDISIQDRKDRTKRLCDRGARLETFLKEPDVLLNEDVFGLLDYLFSSPNVKRIVDEMIAIRKEEKSGSIDAVLTAAKAKMAEAAARNDRPRTETM